MISLFRITSEYASEANSRAEVRKSPKLEPPTVITT